jgi:hypothetical protein
MANTNTPAISEAQVIKTWNFSQNADGSLSPSISVGGANASVGVTGVPAPASATEMGIVDALGKLQGVSALNPLPIVGSIVATNPSVGTVGILAPTSATEIGVVDGLGKLQAASSSNPVRTDPTGTTTQPVSASSLPLPAGASTSGKQPAFGTAGTASADVLTIQGIASMTPVKMDGSGVTQPISAIALPLPTGAAISSKQPAIGTAGSASADVLSIQGIASMTPLKVDGSGVTQPVSLPAGQAMELLDSGGVNKASISAAGALKVDGSAATQPVSGTVSLTAATAVELLDASGVNKAAISAAGAVKVDGSAVTQPVSIAATISENLAQIAGAAIVTAASGVQKVGVVGGAGTSLETTAGVLDHNLKNINNVLVVTAALELHSKTAVGRSLVTAEHP